jgi:DNA-binding MarR family transcriptional regulator
VYSLAIRAQHYLHETLGIPISGCQGWTGQDALPYFLRDAFDFNALDILGHTVLLVLDKTPEKLLIGDIRSKLDKVRSVAKQPTVYVTGALASYERKRLIEQKVSFIVPGNQLYIPDLGLDLREYFRQRPTSAESLLSPSAQAMLITALLRPHWASEWHPAEVATTLGYTPMTLSRTVRELSATGLASIHKTGRSQYLTMTFSPRETWERANLLMRSPVQRTIWTATPIPPDLTIRLAGLSALARHSMLTEPRQPVHAVSRTAWQSLKSTVNELPEAMPGAYEWQLWNYNPALQPGSDMVDPLSLGLSLRDSPDERVQSALDVLKEQLPW